MLNRRMINIRGIFHPAPMPHLTSPAAVSYLGAHNPAFIFGETSVLTVRPKCNGLPHRVQLWSPRNSTVRE
jgi:hypothetical protein